MTAHPKNIWQPQLEGQLIKLKPLVEDDFAKLYEVGSDPEVWAQHPERDRYKHENFLRFFKSGIESKGAFAILDKTSGEIIGTSRYTGHDVNESVIEIGYTFVARKYWGKGHNSELKRLMLDHAFTIVNKVQFYIGESNFRSRRAVEKLGAKLARMELRNPAQGNTYNSVVYELNKQEWEKRKSAGEPSQDAFVQSRLETARLVLEPIVESHAEEMWTLFNDPELHHYVPFEPLSLEKQKERCARWASRRSPDGAEIWLNWAGRDKASGLVVAHFQGGVKEPGSASIGYLVAKAYQRKGYAAEGLEAVFEYLRSELGVREVKAWSDTRNVASHQLARKLGMEQVEFIKDADFFKGQSSDEYVFARRL